jgi:predicted regulator of Ras-like GTPase activity (Roadblock/LC7/MglB family)
MSEVTRSATAAGQRRPDMTVVAEALRELSREDDAVLGGLLVAGADGLVLSAQTKELQVDMLAVMAAVIAGIASQLVDQAGVGTSRSCLIEGSSGHVAVFPLPASMVLVVVGQHEVSTGLFNHAARSALARLRMAITVATPP